MWCKLLDRSYGCQHVSKLTQDSMTQAFLTDICNQLDAINLSSVKTHTLNIDIEDYKRSVVVFIKSHGVGLFALTLPSSARV